MRHFLLAIGLVVLAPIASRAAVPTCALLDPEKTPRAALLEAKLLTEPGATWVERANIDAVLKEQKFQALFSPQGVGERVKLGKLLKADLLIMVRAVKDAKEPALEVIISETASGLRLLVRAVPFTKDADADVAALLSAARDGLKRHDERIAEIVAVPPFISQDLEYTHDHLKGAFAKLTEAEALGRKGVVVVELAEAEALAKELALAVPGAKLARPLPVYLLGEYRHDGKGKDRTVTLKLRAERAGKPIGKPESATLKAEESAGAVRKWAARVLDALAKDGEPRPPADPKAEAKQLVERAMMFRRLGNWVEALALIESSFLIVPDQLELHATALTVICPLVQERWAPATQGQIALEPVAQLYLRGLVHLEAYVSGGGELVKYEGTRGNSPMELFISANNLIGFGPGTPAVKKRLLALQSEQREVLLRMIPVLAKQGARVAVFLVSMAVGHLPPAERYELLGDIILQLEDLPLARSRTVAYVHRGYASLAEFNGPPFQALLQRLDASKNADVRAAAADLRQKLANDLKAKPAKFTTDHNKPATDPNRVRLEPVKLSGINQEAANLKGLIACGPGVDALWSKNAVFLMKEKGKLIPAWRTKEEFMWITTLCFDGRFVWAAACDFKTGPILVVIDPKSGKTREVGAADGLPKPDGPDGMVLALPTLLVAPLEPGRVGVVGSHGRAWAAVVAFDSGKDRADVKLILKATEVQDRGDRTQWTRTDVAFSLTFLLAITSPDGKAGRRLLVGRGSGTDTTTNLDLASRPLVLDPDRGTAEVFKEEFNNWPRQSEFGTANGTVYFCEAVSTTESRLFRVAFPAAKKEVIATGLPNDIKLVVVHQGRIHMSTAHLERDPTIKPDPKARVNPQWKTICRWWTVDADGKNVRLSADNLPEMCALAVSSHYGLVALVGSRDRGTLHTVEVAEPAPKK